MRFRRHLPGARSANEISRLITCRNLQHPQIINANRTGAKIL